MENADAFDFSGTGKLAFTVKEIREHTGLSKTSVYRLINSRRLRSVKVAGRRLVMTRDLEELFASGIALPRSRRITHSRRAANEA